MEIYVLDEFTDICNVFVSVTQVSKGWLIVNKKCDLQSECINFLSKCYIIFWNKVKSNGLALLAFK